MRRRNVVAYRWGSTYPWLNHVPIKNYFLITRFTFRARELTIKSLNNLQRIRISRHLLFRHRFARRLLTAAKHTSSWLYKFFYKRKIRRLRYRDQRLPVTRIARHFLLGRFFGSSKRAFKRRYLNRVIRVRLFWRRRSFMLFVPTYYRRLLTPHWRRQRWLRRATPWHIRRTLSGQRRLRQLGPQRVNRFRVVGSLILYDAIKHAATQTGVVAACSPTLLSRWFFRNTQLTSFASRVDTRAFLQLSASFPPSRRYMRRVKMFAFSAGILHCAFKWRNLYLFSHVISLEFSRTRHYYRFMKLFSRVLRLFVSMRYAIVVIVVRARGCFGPTDRARTMHTSPTEKLNVPVYYQVYNQPIQFAFQHVVTRRGIFGLAFWVL